MGQTPGDPASAQALDTTPVPRAIVTGRYATVGPGASWPRDLSWEARTFPWEGPVDQGEGSSGEAGSG
ncbi:hypothetical protein [Cyanobium sp. Morenito 9A2]|uniref:hypothetical protein n=1 Tax=Cyanobium sp. Morenito 9A2 TaxID=2823718 RepID=UPI0020CE0B1A|nr:hypothetical protein [Cyanobium sp. Morenito 9A2]MCP9848574.1 hypothetical protein [Cyanobium sp. Morenito 9A2]